jgi:hypothetical protein
VALAAVGITALLRGERQQPTAAATRQADVELAR